MWRVPERSTRKTWSVPGRPAMSTYLRSSIVPSVPSSVSRPSPQVGKPSAVNQSQRIAAGTVAAQQDLAEILEAGQIIRAEMADRRGHDLRLRRAREMQELVDLVRGDVGQDAAIGRRIEEPAGPDRSVEDDAAQARPSG